MSVPVLGLHPLVQPAARDRLGGHPGVLDDAQPRGVARPPVPPEAPEGDVVHDGVGVLHCVERGLVPGEGRE